MSIVSIVVGSALYPLIWKARGLRARLLRILNTTVINIKWLGIMEGGAVVGVGVDADTEGVYLGGIKDWVCIAKHNKNGYPKGYPFH